MLNVWYCYFHNKVIYFICDYLSHDISGYSLCPTTKTLTVSNEAEKDILDFMSY